MTENLREADDVKGAGVQVVGREPWSGQLLSVCS